MRRTQWREVGMLPTTAPHDPSPPSASFCPAVKHPPAEPSRFVSVPTKMPDKMGFDEVFMINLKRRQDRRERMLWALWAQEIKVRLVEAVDG
ncbi:PREDICTED: procollagen galactosyltransferase 1-like, partial [Myotis davidii]|uniref:procollagen galactosyltransferase 1-like n=1 Tax=Myotis davidii TaxID=225400 RepID=UPI0003EBFA2D